MIAELRTNLDRVFFLPFNRLTLNLGMVTEDVFCLLGSAYLSLCACFLFRKGVLSSLELCLPVELDICRRRCQFEDKSLGFSLFYFQK